MSDTLDQSKLQDLLANANANVPATAKAAASQSGGGGLIQQGLAQKQAAITQSAPLMQKAADATEAGRKEVDAAVTNAPDDLQKVEAWKPEKQPSDPISAFGSLGTVFAVLASGLTHQPMMNAFNAAASAINARKANDDEAYNKAYDAWKSNVNLAVKKTDDYVKHFNMIKDKAALDPKAYMDEAKLIAYQNDAQGDLALLAQGKLDDHANAMQARAKNSLEMKALVDKLAQQKQESDIIKHVVDGLPPGATPQEKAVAIGQAKAALSGKKLTEGENLSQMQAKFASQLYQANKIKGMSDEEAMSDALSQAKSTGAGQRESIMNQRVLVYANTAAKDLENIASLPVSVNTGLFGQTHQAASLMEVPEQYLKGAFTPDVDKFYNDAMVGLGRALSGIEVGGLQVNQGLQKQFEGLLIAPSDSGIVKLNKLAHMRQDAEIGVNTLANNPHISEDQKKQIGEIREMLNKSIPWTVEDTNKLLGANDGTKSLADFAKQQMPDKEVKTVTSQKDYDELQPGEPYSWRDKDGTTKTGHKGQPQ